MSSKVFLNKRNDRPLNESLMTLQLAYLTLALQVVAPFRNNIDKIFTRNLIVLIFHFNNSFFLERFIREVHLNNSSFILVNYDNGGLYFKQLILIGSTRKSHVSQSNNDIVKYTIRYTISIYRYQYVLKIIMQRTYF